MSKIGLVAAFGLLVAAGAGQAQPQPPRGTLRAGTVTMCPASVVVTAPNGWVSVGRGGGQTQFQAPLHMAILTDAGQFLCEYGTQTVRIGLPGRSCAVVNPRTWSGDLKVVSAITCGAMDVNGVSHPDACQVQCQP